MSEIFISYARSTEAQAHRIAEALRALGYGVWRDDELPAHRSFSEVIEERLKAAKAVVVLWSADAVKSHWVQSEADWARGVGKLVQIGLDGARLPMPFDRIQCADLSAWSGEAEHANWRKVVASVGELVGGAAAPAPAAMAEVPPPSAPPLPSKPSIAVMPFANLSNDPEQDYFCDGMMEEIVNALTRIKSIFVIASGSTLSFKGQAVSPQEVASRLGVRYVLDCSVRRSANRVRVSVKLTDATDGVQIWADRFDDTLEDIFELQDKVALSVAGVIEPAVSEAEIRRAASRPTGNMSSYDLYLRSLSVMQTVMLTRDLVREAIDLLARAIELDPGHAAALAYGANCLRISIQYGWSDDLAADRSQAMAWAARAIDAGGDDPRVLGLCANVRMALDEDFARASALIDRAISLNPGSAFVWMMSGMIRMRAGEPDRALDDLDRAARLDPISARGGAMQQAFTAYGRFEQGRFEEAYDLLRRSPFREPIGQAVLAAVCGHTGRLDEARAALDQYRAASQTPIETLAANWFRRPEHLKLFLDGVALATNA